MATFLVTRWRTSAALVTVEAEDEFEASALADTLITDDKFELTEDDVEEIEKIPTTEED